MKTGPWFRIQFRLSQYIKKSLDNWCAIPFKCYYSAQSAAIVKIHSAETLYMSKWSKLKATQLKWLLFSWSSKGTSHDKEREATIDVYNIVQNCKIILDFHFDKLISQMYFEVGFQDITHYFICKILKFVRVCFQTKV